MEKFNSWKEYYESNQNYYFDNENLTGADIGACDTTNDVGVYYYSNIRFAVIKSSDEAIILTEADPWDVIRTLRGMDKIYYIANEFMNAAGIGLTDEVKSTIIESASNYDYTEEGFRLFLAEEGWQDWMNGYTESEDSEGCTEAEIAEMEKIQRELFDEAHRFCYALKRLRKDCGYTQLSLSEKFDIPKRTIGDWECGVSEPPVWAQKLIINAIADCKSPKK